MRDFRRGLSLAQACEASALPTELIVRAQEVTHLCGGRQRHPSPAVMARGPNELWSWDITKLLGRRRGPTSTPLTTARQCAGAPDTVMRANEPEPGVLGPPVVEPFETQLPTAGVGPETQNISAGSYARMTVSGA